jgi:RHS repeat-associated protein
MKHCLRVFYLILIQIIMIGSISLGQTLVTAPLNQPNTTGVYFSPTSITLTPGFSTTSGGDFHAFIQSNICAPLLLSASIDKNYIITWTPKVEGITTSPQLYNAATCEVMASIQYFDGLGRPLQNIQVKGSPEADKDIVQPIAFDQYGREVKKYLSYASSSNNGSYKVDALSAGAGVFAFYNPTNSSGSQLPNGVARIPTPFAETRFEPSPLSRVEEQGAPGDAWQLVANSTAGHTQKIVYGTNTSYSEVSYWIVNLNGATTSSYQPGQLYKTISKDENWQTADGKAGTTEEFKDKEGKVVLKRIWETNTKSLSTYYVYDDFGNLRYVLPPAVNENGENPISFTETDAVFLNFIYGYHYDRRNRLIEKKIPGKGWEYMVYNKIDQLIMSQDAIQRAANKWVFTKYDGLGRPVISGIYTDATHTTRTSQQTRVDAEINPSDPKPLWESKTDTGTGYTDAAYPRGSTSYLTINYYDDYTFPGNPFTGSNPKESNQTRSLQTGMKVYRTDGTNPLYTSMYYDKKGNLIQSQSQNHLSGTDVLDNTYSFIGELTSSTRTHVAYNQTTTIAINYTYDHMGRKLNTQQSINGASPTILSQNTYNEIGQLKNKGLHNNLQTTAYTYNERGWLKSSFSSQLSMELRYQDAINGAIPQYNGNIANQYYTNGSSNTFNYSYDKLNRLTKGEVASTVMSEALTYDVMGNIQTLSRDGGTVGTYNYTGNRLSNITGGPLATNTYQYDSNGNATTDGRNNKTIAYNILNLPQTVSGGLSYIYDATGKKLQKNSNGTIRNYVNGIEYNGTTIEFIQTEEGIARNNGGSYSYEYNLTDHLGNVRATFYKNPISNNLDILQRDNYYAFGKRAIVNGGTNKYLYNGKELQEELGEQYDYGARFYDPVIGRWNVVDALAEKYFTWSPYNYVVNNPIKYIDPDGNDILIGYYIRQNGKTIGYTVKYNKDGTLSNSNGSPYTRNNAYIKKVASQLNQLKLDDKVVNDLIGGLQDSDKKHLIQNLLLSEDGGNEVNTKMDKFRLEVEGSVMSYDPNSNETVRGDKRDPRVGLAHELKHVDNIDNNMVKKGYTETGVSMEEVDAVNTENRIRKATGDPKRTSYGGKKIDKKYLDE